MDEFCFTVEAGQVTGFLGVGPHGRQVDHDADDRGWTHLLLLCGHAAVAVLIAGAVLVRRAV